jgi:hypothetical protein
MAFSFNKNNNTFYRDAPDIRPDNPVFFKYPVYGRIPDLMAGYLAG